MSAVSGRYGNGYFTAQYGSVFSQGSERNPARCFGAFVVLNRGNSDSELFCDFAAGQAQYFPIVTQPTSGRNRV